MDKQATLETIMALLDLWRDDADLPPAGIDAAKAIYEQMPITMAESSNGDTPNWTFEELVRSAGHDVTWRVEV